MCCRGGLVFPAEKESNSHSAGVVAVGAMHSVIAFNRDQHLDCDTPHYIYLGAVLSLLSVAIFVRLSAIIKLVFLMLICVSYTFAVELVNRAIFQQFDHHNPLRSIAVLLVFIQNTWWLPYLKFPKMT